MQRFALSFVCFLVCLLATSCADNPASDSHPQVAQDTQGSRPQGPGELEDSQPQVPESIDKGMMIDALERDTGPARQR
jgi:hypothetical protein